MKKRIKKHTTKKEAHQEENTVKSVGFGLASPIMSDLELWVEKRVAKNGAAYRKISPSQDKRKGPNSNGACRGVVGVGNKKAIDRLKSNGWQNGLRTIQGMFPKSKPGNCGTCQWEE